MAGVSFVQGSQLTARKIFIVGRILTQPLTDDFLRQILATPAVIADPQRGPEFRQGRNTVIYSLPDLPFCNRIAYADIHQLKSSASRIAFGQHRRIPTWMSK